MGNILSYTPYTDLNNPDQDQSLRGSYLNGSTDLNESTDATFEVNINNTFSEETTRSSEIGLEVGASVGGYGIEIEGTANYTQGAISTHTTVSNEIDIKVHFGPIDRGLGETNFNVIPYVYWAKNGALVVDYAARTISPSQGGTATLTALISHFSVKETEDAVSVSFYIGDPANDMTEIHETNNIGWWVIGRSDFTNGVKDKPYSNLSESQPYFTKSYPNPFHESFTIAYESVLPGNVSVKMYDLRGGLMFAIIEGYKSAGLHRLEVPGQTLTPGLYYYRFSNGTATETRKIVKH